MENKILYNLLFVCKNLEEQEEVISKLKELPKDSLANETVKIIEASEAQHKKNKLSTPNSIQMHFSFRSEDINLDDIFWDLNEEEASGIDLTEMAKLFVEQKEKENNLEKVKEALRNYEESGDVSHLTDLNLENKKIRDFVIPIESATRSTLKKLKDIKEKKDFNTIKFTNKFFLLQMILKGLQPGELIILAARPGVGKTAYSLALLNDVSKQNKKTLFFSLEMSKEDLIERMLTAKTGITRSTIFSESNFTDEKYQKMIDASKEIDKQSIKIIDEPPTSFIEIKEIIKNEHKKNGLDIVFIDYLGLIANYKENDNLDIRNTITKISRDAKLLAKELKIPVILLQQVNREAAKSSREDSSFKELFITDLRDSGTLEQDADKVFLLYNQKPETEEEKKDVLDSKYKVILKIAKNRNGQSNQKILLGFDHNYQRIKEVDWLTKPSSWVDRK